MEGSFETRKRELEKECVVPSGMFDSSLQRLQAFMQPFLNMFRRCEQTTHATQFVSGLCSDLERKNAESIAYLYDQDRKTIQHFIGESQWDDQALRDELASQVGDQLGETTGVIVFDPSAFPKSGKQSVGVGRQWCGRLGKIDNCQVGVYMAYVSSKGHALVDTQLYLPKEWTEDKKRMKRAGIPKDRQLYRTRHQMCLELLDQHVAKLPHAWVTGDDEFGRPAKFRRQLRERNEHYLLAVPSNTQIRDLRVVSPQLPDESTSDMPTSAQRVDKWAAACSDDEWTKIEVRDGEKGPITIEAIKCPVETGWKRYSTLTTEVLVVIRYRNRDSRVIQTDYYLSNAPSDTALAEFCRAAKAHWRIEECIKRGKSQAGLADYEVRNWCGWQHHQTLSLIASWYLTVETRRAEKKGSRHDLQSSSSFDRSHTSYAIAMRYTPRRQRPYRTSATAKPASKTLSLEKAQATSSKELRAH
jgi:SRSO17 transposase